VLAAPAPFPVLILGRITLVTVVSFLGLAESSLIAWLLFLMVMTGVQVPVAFWPAPVRFVAQGLPLTHGLQAVRDLLAGSPARGILLNIGLEILVGFGWLFVAIVTFRRLAISGRKDGSIEFGG